MSGVGFVLAMAVGACVTLGAVVLFPRPLAPVSPNYRGSPVPMALGPAFVIGVTVVVGIDLLVAVVGGTLRVSAWRPAAVILALLLVFCFGLLDDFRAGPGRGLLGHFRELLHGRVTTGVGKLGAALAASGLAVTALGSGPLRLALGIPFVAGATNLWNLLDVRPGRAAKYFLLAMGTIALIDWTFAFRLYLVPASLGASVALLPFDLRERAMLGDSGSNALGFVVGVASFRLLPTWGLGLGLGGILALHLAAETVTLSRLIEATSPLRWFDGIGRLPAEQAGPQGGLERKDSSAT
jgi:UDP-GlcNAc:undecaprenyl-phosphate/decaprenyl-phosphate GlcNAc-1-phosphate transferase